MGLGALGRREIGNVKEENDILIVNVVFTNHFRLWTHSVKVDPAESVHNVQRHNRTAKEPETYIAIGM